MEEIKCEVIKKAQTENRWCVYIHTNLINWKKYIGITGQKPEERWRKDGKGYKNCILFWRAIQKYGWNNFKHEVILTNETYEYACKVEKCLIKHYQTTNPKYGYNITSGGDGVSGIKPWNYGIPMTDQQKEKLRQANIGRKITEETRKKLSDAKKGKRPNNAGKPMSDRAKKKLSESLKGHVISDETRQKIGDANKGKCVGINHPKHRLIYCIELNEIFSCARDTNKKYGFSASNIVKCCKGNRNFAHKHPETNDELHWLYIEDALCKNYITQEQLEQHIKNDSTKLFKGDDNNGKQGKNS